MVSNKTLVFLLAAASLVMGQEANPTQAVQVEPGMPTPIFRIEVVARTTAAVNYLHLGSATKINFEGTSLMNDGRGTATVQSERGVTRVSAEFKNFAAPSTFGPEYLTYVLWAISPDGRPANMGELTLDHYGNGSHSDIKTTSELQTFGMIVTAEPYYAVTQPSDVVVLENVVRKDTVGVIETVDAKYELLPRGIYTNQGKAQGFQPIIVGKKNPFELYEAENAVMLARLAGAEKYAADSYQKALESLAWATRNQNQKPGQKPVITMAREAALRAEDSRVIALRVQREQFDQSQKDESLARENASKAKAEDEARQRMIADTQRAQADSQRAQAEAQRAQAEADRMAAERAKSEAQAATQQARLDQQQSEAARLAAERARGEAEQATERARHETEEQQAKLSAAAEEAREAAAKAKHEADEQQARLAADAEQSRNAAAKAQQEQAEMRRQLTIQFNQVLDTRESARGLIVNMSDVLFDTAQYTLKPGAREKLAKVSGIILAHPGLKIAVEGHTDSVGGDEYNMKLSQNRAKAVREYLVAQGLNSGTVTADGFGKTRPVADNKNAAGRQQNRRVEMVVSGDILGTPAGSAATDVH